MSDSGENDNWIRKRIEQLDRSIAVCDAYLITVFGSLSFLTVILVLSLIDK
jgi:hypothetical protein